jgi:hypothetical protein
MEDNIDLSKNTELDKALKEFEVQNNTVPIEPGQEISSVLTATPKNYQPKEMSKMVKLVMKLFSRIVKDEKQAEYVLLGFTILAITISLFLFFGGSINTVQNQHPIYQEDLTPTLRKTLPRDVLNSIPYKYGK